MIFRFLSHIQRLGHHPSTFAQELHDGQLPGEGGPRGAAEGGEARGEVLGDSRCWDWDRWSVMARKTVGKPRKAMGK